MVGYGILQSIYLDGFLGYFAQYTYVFELSSIFVNTRHILVYHQMQKTAFYIVNGLMMVFAFFSLRVVIGSVIVYKIVQSLFSPLLKT